MFQHACFIAFRVFVSFQISINSTCLLLVSSVLSSQFPTCLPPTLPMYTLLYSLCICISFIYVPLSVHQHSPG
ncbi:hypothetical protein EJD97_019302, partial [Solanum chilense]